MSITHTRKTLFMTALAGLVMSLVVALGAIHTPAASAATQHAAAPAAATHSNLDYCGPAFTSKGQMVDWLMSHPAERNKAEAYVREHAGYYHIRADQSFIAWLTMPNIKFKKAPSGYMIYSNTGCDASGNVIDYNGKYGVSNLPMLWWCNDPKGTGSNCTPIAKFYCRNWVMGRMVFLEAPTPAVKPKAKPKPPATPCCNLPFKIRVRKILSAVRPNGTIAGNITGKKGSTNLKDGTTIGLKEFFFRTHRQITSGKKQYVSAGTGYQWVTVHQRGDLICEQYDSKYMALRDKSAWPQCQKITGPGQCITFWNIVPTGAPTPPTPTPTTLVSNKSWFDAGDNVITSAMSSQSVPVTVGVYKKVNGQLVQDGSLMNITIHPGTSTITSLPNAKAGEVVNECEPQAYLDQMNAYATDPEGTANPAWRCVSNIITGDTVTINHYNRNKPTGGCTSNCSPPTGCTSNCSPPPASHNCSMNVYNANKSTPNVANVSVATDGSLKYVVYNWGDGNSDNNGSSDSHTYPEPPASNNGGGVTYQISATAYYTDGQSASCKDSNGNTSVAFYVPAPPANGNTGVPQPNPTPGGQTTSGGSSGSDPQAGTGTSGSGSSGTGSGGMTGSGSSGSSGSGGTTSGGSSGYDPPVGTAGDGQSTNPDGTVGWPQ